MRGELVTYGPWHIPVCVKHALCADGKRRYAKITSPEPDTFFSIPASVHVQGKTITGYITGRETDGDPDYEFRAVRTGKNYALLPNEEKGPVK